MCVCVLFWTHSTEICSLHRNSETCVFTVHGNSETCVCVCSAREFRDRCVCLQCMRFQTCVFAMHGNSETCVFAVDFVSVICNCRASVMLSLGQDTKSVWQWYQGHCFLTIMSMMSPSDVIVYLKHTGLQLTISLSRLNSQFSLKFMFSNWTDYYQK